MARKQKPAISMKPRSPNHPGVRVVLAAFDRSLASRDKTVYVAVGGMIAELGDTVGRFDHGTWWSREGVRAMLLTQAQYAPPDEFRRLVAEAKRQHKWIEWWDAEGFDAGKRAPSGEETASATAVH